jgi:hypothetical protein
VVDIYQVLIGTFTRCTEFSSRTELTGRVIPAITRSTAGGRLAEEQRVTIPAVESSLPRQPVCDDGRAAVNAPPVGHQLWFHFGRLAHADKVPEQALPAAEPSPRLVRLRFRWVQLLLCDVPRDLSRVSAQLAPVDAGLAERLRAEAGLAGLRGWSPRTLSLAQRGLRILAAVHGPGEPVKASTVRQLAARNMPFPHIIDVLAAAGVLADDRPDSLAVWLDGQLAGLPAQIRAELDAWLTLLRHGGPPPQAAQPQDNRPRHSQHPDSPDRPKNGITRCLGTPSRSLSSTRSRRFRVVGGLRSSLTISAHDMADRLRSCWTRVRVSGRGSWLSTG